MTEKVQLKEIKVSEVINYLKSGVTRWEKEDLGFGSLEKLYDLTFTEMKELMDHPKIKGVKTKIPTLRIIDDTEGEPEETAPETAEEITTPVVETMIQVTPVETEVKPVVKKKQAVPFI